MNERRAKEGRLAAASEPQAAMRLMADALVGAPAMARAEADLEQIFREHHAKVMNAAYRVTGSPADAEDVAQTVFLRLARGDMNVSEIQNLGAYLHRSAVNTALDLLRARRDSRHVAVEDAGELHSVDPS